MNEDDPAYRSSHFIFINIVRVGRWCDVRERRDCCGCEKEKKRSVLPSSKEYYVCEFLSAEKSDFRSPVHFGTLQYHTQQYSYSDLATSILCLQGRLRHHAEHAQHAQQLVMSKHRATWSKRRTEPSLLFGNISNLIRQQVRLQHAISATRKLRGVVIKLVNLTPQT